MTVERRRLVDTTNRRVGLGKYRRIEIVFYRFFFSTFFFTSQYNYIVFELERRWGFQWRCNVITASLVYSYVLAFIYCTHNTHKANIPYTNRLYRDCGYRRTRHNAGNTVTRYTHVFPVRFDFFCFFLQSMFLSGFVLRARFEFGHVRSFTRYQTKDEKTVCNSQTILWRLPNRYELNNRGKYAKRTIAHIFNLKFVLIA